MVKERITVVMPGRNEGKTVDSTLESLFAQTRIPDEIILGDGCSTDGTRELFMRHADRGVPMSVMVNESLYAGGGRNVGVRAAKHELIVNMDFGNLADPHWLESMAKPFEDDPELDFLGGVYLPRVDGQFERVCAAVVFFSDALAMSMTREQIEAMVGDQLQSGLPGGMCMAFRRRIFDQTGGFAEWAQRGQDRLFGERIRELGGKIANSLDPIIHFNMSSSVRGLYLHRYRYSLWEARLGLPRGRFERLFRWYLGGLVALVAIAWLGGWLVVPALALLTVTYIYAVAWRSLGAIAKATGEPFSIGSYLLAIPVLFARDAGIILGGLCGSFDRLVSSKWRKITRRYLKEGC